MTDRKPDFYVVKREGLDGVPEWFTYEAPYGLWSCRPILRQQFVTKADSAKIAKKYGGRVVPVFCTSKRAEPKMRERSSAWVLKRLAEGKVVVHHRSGIELMYRFCDGQIQYYDDSLKRWKASAGIGDDNGCTARIARPSEVPQ